MSTRALWKHHLNVYKPTRTTYLHKVPRQALLSDPKVKHPIYHRLPSFWREEFETPDPNVHQVFENDGTPRPQHDGLWKRMRVKGEKMQPVRVENINIPIHFCPEAEEGIWGGETIIRAYRYPKNGKKRKLLNWYWTPQIIKRTVYSEILDRYIKTTFTPRALDMIDAAYGFDNFILQTHVKVLRKFASSLKREMLLVLANKDTQLYPNDPEKREEIYNKYKEYEIDEDRASWVGLDLREAMLKQWTIEKEAGYYDPKPLLDVYTEQLLASLNLQEGGEDEGEGELPVEGVIFDRSATSSSVSK